MPSLRAAAPALSRAISKKNCSQPYAEEYCLPEEALQDRAFFI
jgi:hypothetical protein